MALIPAGALVAAGGQLVPAVTGALSAAYNSVVNNAGDYIGTYFPASTQAGHDLLTDMATGAASGAAWGASGGMAPLGAALGAFYGGGRRLFDPTLPPRRGFLNASGNYTLPSRNVPLLGYNGSSPAMPLVDPGLLSSAAVSGGGGFHYVRRGRMRVAVGRGRFIPRARGRPRRGVSRRFPRLRVKRVMRRRFVRNNRSVIARGSMYYARRGVYTARRLKRY